MRQRLGRALACLTLLAVLAGLMTAPASAAGFRDVPAGHWAAESIQRCVSLGFFQGKSADRFGLGEEMTRSAFAVVLCRFFGWEAPAPESATFTDVPLDAWYAGAVEAAYDHGAVTDQREEFRPNDAITGAEAAVMLQNVLLLPVPASKTEEVAAPAWAQDSVQAMTAGGVCLPDADASVTRLDAAVMLYRVSKLAETAPGLEVFRRAE